MDYMDMKGAIQAGFAKAKRPIVVTEKQRIERQECLLNNIQKTGEAFASLVGSFLYIQRLAKHPQDLEVSIFTGSSMIETTHPQFRYYLDHARNGEFHSSVVPIVMGSGYSNRFVALLYPQTATYHLKTGVSGLLESNNKVFYDDGVLLRDPGKRINENHQGHTVRQGLLNNLSLAWIVEDVARLASEYGLIKDQSPNRQIRSAAEVQKERDAFFSSNHPSARLRNKWAQARSGHDHYSS